MRRTSVVIVLALTWLSWSGCNLQDPAPFTGRQPSLQPPTTTPTPDMSSTDMNALVDMSPMMDMTAASPDADMSTIPTDMEADMSTEMGCVPRTTAEICASASEIECGVHTGDDGCGVMREVDCGGCSDTTQTCTENICVCNTARSCPAMPSCGTIENACGEMLECLCDGANTCQVGSCEEVALSSPTTDLAKFGTALLLRGDMLVVGAPGENADTGAVYIFEREPTNKIWKQTHRITSSSMQGGAEFGSSLAFDGQTLFIGEPGLNLSGQGQAGAVVLFVLSPMNGQWVQTGRLQADPPRRRGRYGQALALEGDQLFVGEPSEVDEGHVDIYTRETTAWKRTRTLAPDGTNTEETEFGAALASDGDWLAIGEPRARGSRAREGGAVNMYSRASGTWKLTESLETSGDKDLFGGSLALDKDKLVVGAPGANNEDGTAFSFVLDARASKWVANNELTLPSGGFTREYGYAVALSNDRAFVGMSVGALPSPLGVHAFISDRMTMKWSHKHMYQPMDTVSEYGVAIAADGNTIAVGSPNETVAGSRAGVVYIHDVFF